MRCRCAQHAVAAMHAACRRGYPCGFKNICPETSRLGVVSPPVNPWDWCTANRLGSKCLCSLTLLWVLLCLFWEAGGEEWCLCAPSFLEKSSNTLRNQHEYIRLLFPRHYVKWHVYIASLHTHRDLAITHPPGSPSAGSADLQSSRI